MIHATITIKVTYPEDCGLTNQEIQTELEEEVNSFISRGGLTPDGSDLIVETHSATVEVK